MKIFPERQLEFILVGEQTETISKLERRTEKSKYLTSQVTDKSFRGTINGNEFKIISSTIGKGAFCVMSGKIESGEGIVKVEIHNVFKILLSIMLVLPIIGLLALAALGNESFSPEIILVIILQIIIIRFLFIGLAFRFLSSESLNRLRDVLDIEWK